MNAIILPSFWLIGPALLGFALRWSDMARMMGVRRTSVSVIAKELQDAGLIAYRRGRVQIANAEKLKEVGVDVVLSYTGNTNSQYPSAAAFLIDRLKK